MYGGPCGLTKSLDKIPFRRNPRSSFGLKKKKDRNQILIPRVKYSVSCFKGVASLWPLLWRWSVANPLRNNGALTTVGSLIISNSTATQQQCTQKKDYTSFVLVSQETALYFNTSIEFFMHYMLSTTCVTLQYVQTVPLDIPQYHICSKLSTRFISPSLQNFRKCQMIFLI